MAPDENKLQKLLKELADELTFSDVGSLKFVCRDKIGAASLDRIPNDKPLLLFKLLKERVLITSENLTWLRAILQQIQRIDLVGKIPEELCRQSSVDVVDSGAFVGTTPVSGGGVYGADVLSPFLVLLNDLAGELTRDNIEEMKFLLDIPDGKAEKITDGEGLLIYLQNNGQLSSSNFKELKCLLNDIYRKDLIKKIEEFSMDEATPQPQPVYRDPDSCYPMRRPHGFALVINIKNFKGKTDDGLSLNERKGSDVDVTNLKDLWRQLGLQVEDHQDLKAHGICTVVDDMAKKIDTNSSCFVCCIMTHGDMGKIYGSDSKHVDIKHITNVFKQDNCPALAGKPKLFFITACRGQEKLTGRGRLPETPARRSTPSSTQETGVTQELDAIPVPRAAAATLTTSDVYNINDSAFRHDADPNEAHFLLGYSTVPGHVSFRSVDHGTWYVIALVQVFSAYYTDEDVTAMMVKVNRQVDDAYTNEGYKQCAAPVVTLTKKVYF